LNDEPVRSDDLCEEDRGKLYTCPNCGKYMVVVIPNHKINHFRHDKNDGCTCNTEPETEEHVLMKQTLSEMLSKWNPDYHVELEKRIPAKKAPNGFRASDIFLANRPNKAKIAVECQVSSINEDEVLQRTVDYNAQNCAVLWMLSSSEFSDYRDEDSLNQELRVSDVELLLHEKYHLRVYYMNTDDSMIFDSHFEKVRRVSKYKGYRYYLKKTRVLDSLLIRELKIYVTRSSYEINGRNAIIARFRERKWW
jgi:competence CoiA-like predicted nuclease